MLDIGDRAVVAEQQSGGSDRGHVIHRCQGEIQIELGRRCCWAHLGQFRDEDSCGVPGVEVTGVGIDQADVVIGVTRIVEGLQ